MQPESAAETGDVDRQQAGLRYRQPTRLSRGRIGRVVVIRDDHVAAVVAAEEEDADQGSVIRRLGQGVEQAEALERQGCGAEGAERSTQKFSAGNGHGQLLYRCT